MGYKLASQRNSDNHVINHLAGANAAPNLALARRVVMDDISLCVAQNTPNISNQKLMLGHLVSKAATELSFTKRSSFTKDVATENNWTLELGVGDGIDIHIYVKVGFMERDKFNQQHHNNDTFLD